MEAYFPLVSKKPYKAKERVLSASANQVPEWGPRRERGLPGIQSTKSTLSSSCITSSLLSTLSDAHNPITHSNIAERSDIIVPFATGHQVSEGRENRGLIIETRGNKLRVQQRNGKVTSDTGILSNARIYINGYLESITDLEMKKIVVEAGGEIVLSPSQCTHIVTSRGLAGSKTQKFLTKKRRNNIYVVKPEWVLDSIAIGKRRPERTYGIVKHSNTLQNFLED